VLEKESDATLRDVTRVLDELQTPGSGERLTMSSMSKKRAKKRPTGARDDANGDDNGDAAEQTGDAIDESARDDDDVAGEADRAEDTIFRPVRARVWQSCVTADDAHRVRRTKSQ
jgi:hypothetical protein